MVLKVAAAAPESAGQAKQQVLHVPDPAGNARTQVEQNAASRKREEAPVKEKMGARGWIAIIIAVAALAGYALSTRYLWLHVKADQADWDRFLALYDGIRALGLAAAGFFFGAKVNLDRAEKAEKKVAEVENDKTEAAAATAGALTTVESLRSTIHQLRDRNKVQPSHQTVVERYLGKLDQLNATFPGIADHIATRSAMMPAEEIVVDGSDWELLANIADEQVNRLRGVPVG